MKKVFCVFLFQIFIQPLSAQEGNFWHTLAEVHFKPEQDEKGYTIERPVFSKNLSSFHSKKITLKGYMIPVGETGEAGKFMLSALPFNVCYFCGAAGPETVVEVETDAQLKFTTKPIVMEGTLMLNSSDPDHHIYILKSATLK